MRRVRALRALCYLLQVPGLQWRAKQTQAFLGVGGCCSLAPGPLMAPSSHRPLHCVLLGRKLLHPGALHPGAQPQAKPAPGQCSSCPGWSGRS